MVGEEEEDVLSGAGVAASGEEETSRCAAAGAVTETMTKKGMRDVSGERESWGTERRMAEI